jgi:uncharacterized protein
MFRIDLNEFERGFLEWEERVEAPLELWSDLPAELCGPLVLEARAELTRDGSVHVAGRLQASLQLTCRRCLDPVSDTLDMALNVSFRPESLAEEEGVWPLELEDGRLDLDPALREELLLALPEYPVCRTDCRGMCPSCGTRLGEETCDCAPEEVDPRWDALRRLSER